MVSDRKPMRYVRPKRERLERLSESQDGKELPWLGRDVEPGAQTAMKVP